MQIQFLHAEGQSVHSKCLQKEVKRKVWREEGRMGAKCSQQMSSEGSKEEGMEGRGEDGGKVFTANVFRRK